MGSVRRKLRTLFVRLNTMFESFERGVSAFRGSPRICHIVCELSWKILETPPRLCWRDLGQMRTIEPCWLRISTNPTGFPA